jgi:hypothetical protein
MLVSMGVGDNAVIVQETRIMIGDEARTFAATPKERRMGVHIVSFVDLNCIIIGGQK